MMTPRLRAALSGDMTPKFLATLDAAGRPNCVPVISITPWDDRTLVFGEFFMNKTRKNLAVNDKVGVAVLNERFEGWSLKGRFLGFETAGPYVDFFNELPLFRYNAYTSVRSAGAIRVEHISEAYAHSKPGLLRDFVHARLVAPLLRRPGQRAMPRRVCDKFRRMQAVRALAYRDADGYPRALPLMACFSAGPTRLLMKGPMLDQMAPPSGSEIAVSIITMEPIAYQVKGIYAGRAAGLGRVDIAECYSASPPLLGERLDAATAVD